MSETTPLIKAALNLRVGVGFDVYIDDQATYTIIKNYIEKKKKETIVSFYVNAPYPVPFLSFEKLR